MNRFPELRRILIILLGALPLTVTLWADLEVELSPESLYVGEITTLRVRMTEEDIARLDSDSISLENLELIRGPRTSSEYRWINGRTTRARVVEYLLSATEPGEGRVRIHFMPASGDPRVIYRTVRISGATTGGAALRGNGPWIVAEASKERVYEGEQLVVTWFVISETTGRTVLQEIPELADFFVEELSVAEEDVSPVAVRGENQLMWPIKRYALVPLSAGTKRIGALEALVPTRRISSWLGGLRSSLDTTTRARSDSIDVLVEPRPAGADLIGSFEIDCSSRAEADPGGPLRIDATVRGDGNLRSATAPEFDGEVPPIARSLSSPAEYRARGEGVEMQKQWTWLIFPSETGPLSLPPLKLEFFDPRAKRERVLRCGGWSVYVDALPGSMSDPEEPDPGLTSTPPAIDGALGLGAVEAVAAGVIASGSLALVALLLRRRRERSRDVDALLRVLENESLFTQRLDAFAIRKGWSPRDLAADKGEEGDAWRAVLSSLDLIGREPWAAEEHRTTLAERLRDLVDRL